MLRKGKRRHPVADLHILVGIQGSGKSRLASALHRDQGLIPLEPDAFRQVLTGKLVHREAEDTVWNHVKIAARVFLRGGHNVLIDATHTTKHSRAMWVNLYREEGRGRLIAHFILTPLSLAIERNNGRKEPVPVDHVVHYAYRLEMPTLSEGFHTVYIYNKNQERIGWAGLGAGETCPAGVTPEYSTLLPLKKLYIDYAGVIDNLQHTKVLVP
jgi:predicted kinase